MSTPRIAFVGAGNMASSIIGGLLEGGHPAGSITAADPLPASLERLREIAPVTVCADNAEAAAAAEVVILAVKPQVMAEAVDSIAAAVRANGALVISIAAGVTIASMQARLGPRAAIVRCMPNTPALLGFGASGLYGNAQVSAAQRTAADNILGAVGITAWVDSEDALDVVTALSGSGPAYFFLFMEIMAETAVSMGLDRDTAERLTLQTGLGAAHMARASGEGLVQLRRRVTSPGGTTERAIQSFKDDNLAQLIAGAMRAAAERAAEMAREMG
ncbi:MAG: pyrroline-5-carboxylate reductase [Halioglobus sp.]|nr:pyrroline-5-carboxylate reductase [Halioglobus sp.]